MGDDSSEDGRDEMKWLRWEECEGEYWSNFVKMIHYTYKQPTGQLF